MAAIEITISGMLYDKLMRTTRPVVLIGDATLTGLSVGGGPLPGGPGGPPLGFWGGVAPPYVDIGGPGPQPHPEHPIVLPPDKPKPPEPIQPPVEWKAVWHPQEGWVVVGVPVGPHPTPSA